MTGICLIYCQLTLAPDQPYRFYCTYLAIVHTQSLVPHTASATVNFVAYIRGCEKGIGGTGT